MSSVAVAAVFTFCCFLYFRLTVSQHPGTKFTKEPQSTVFASLGSDAIFPWKFTFGNLNDWSKFEQIFWGETDNVGNIQRKYISVEKDGKTKFNPVLKESFKSRVNWTGNISQHGCHVQFILRNVTKMDEAVTYGCTAIVFGDDNESGPIKLSVLAPPTITNLSNTTVDVEEGDDVTIHCDATGDPTPNVSWVKDGRILQNSNVTTTLQILKIERRDSGTYVCTAANKVGSMSRSVLVRVVRYKPQINKTASSNPHIQSWINHMTTLKCAVDANPSANFTWLKNGRPILAGVNLAHGMSTLTLTPKTVGDFGLYSCHATNNKGTVSYNITMEQLYPPGPSVINKFTLNVLAFNVSWNAPRDNGGSRVLDYNITLLDVNRRVLQQHNGVKQTSFTMQNLRQNRTYIIVLQARNIVGYGESVNGTVKTLEADPPDPPDIKAVSRILSLNITWYSLMEDSKIEILAYRIKVIDGITHRQVKEYTRIRSTSLLIESLKRNRTYIVAIQARNEAGYGEFANISATTLLAGPPDTPSISNITVFGKHCSLHWKKPYDGESPIITYTVYVWIPTTANGSQYKEKLNSWNTTEMSYDLELDWGRNYSAAVSALNKYGESTSVPMMERQFSTGIVPQEVSTTKESRPVVTSADIPVVTYIYTEESGSTSTVVSLTEVPFMTQETKESGSTRESRKGTFAYLAPLWIVILAFAVPATVFIFWRATKKMIVGSCCKKGCKCKRTTEREKDCERGKESTMEELKERRVSNQYETITEILEVHYNHGHSIEDVKGIDAGDPVTHHYYVPGSTSIYDHICEKPVSPGSKQLRHGKESSYNENGELKSGLGMFNNQMYSHLILGESPNSGFKPPLPDTRYIIPPRNQWEISRDRLKIKNAIGRGEFGLVKKGYALNVSKSGGWIVVAVKTVKENATECDRKDLLSELKVMKELAPHKHVVQLLACITKSEPLCVITEFAPYGDLLGFLRKKRGLNDDYYDIEHLPRRNLTSKQLMKFASEIAAGMAHLSLAKIIHRDLAARNVLLGENLTCKVTDFGMARDIYGKDMYQKNAAGCLPVKWTALEALIEGRYTTKSDVWSFGVVLFEIVTIGGSPYPGMDVLELIEKLESGYRMEKPQHLHDEVYALMRSCWHEDPDKRLTFRQLHKALNRLDKEIQDCINLTTYNGKLYENFQIQLK